MRVYYMAPRRFVRPVAGRVVVDISNRDVPITEPQWVPSTSYFARCIMRGDLVEDAAEGERRLAEEKAAGFVHVGETGTPMPPLVPSKIKGAESAVDSEKAVKRPSK